MLCPALEATEGPTDSSGVILLVLMYRTSRPDSCLVVVAGCLACRLPGTAVGALCVHFLYQYQRLRRRVKEASGW